MNKSMSRSRESKRNYAIWLSGKVWESLRSAALERDGKKCVRCGCGDSLHVHHVRYRKEWNDTQLEDLETLCRICHRKEHGFRTEYNEEFDALYTKLERQLMGSVCRQDLPNNNQMREIALLIKFEDEAAKVRGLIRGIATMKIITRSSKAWTRWLEKPHDEKMKLWPYSENKLNNLLEE